MDNGDVVMVDMTVEKAGVKDKKAFLSLCPRTPEYTSHVIEGFRLRVVQDDGVTIKPDVKFNLTDLSGGIKHFQNRSGKNDSFSITALIHKYDTVRGMKYTSKVDGNYYVDVDSDYNNDLSIMDALDYFIRKGEPFYVTTNAVGIDAN